MIGKMIFDLMLIIGLIIGYINEEKIVRWEREVFIPWIEKTFYKENES